MPARVSAASRAAALDERHLVDSHAQFSKRNACHGCSLYTPCLVLDGAQANASVAWITERAFFAAAANPEFLSRGRLAASQRGASPLALRVSGPVSDGFFVRCLVVMAHAAWARHVGLPLTVAYRSAHDPYLDPNDSQRDGWSQFFAPIRPPPLHGLQRLTLLQLDCRAAAHAWERDAGYAQSFAAAVAQRAARAALVASLPIRPRRIYRQLADVFAARHGVSEANSTLGVHLRGTDKRVDGGITPVRAYLPLIRAYLCAHPHAAVFVATDDERMLATLRASLAAADAPPTRLIVRDAIRSASLLNAGVHAIAMRKRNATSGARAPPPPRAIAEGVLVDMLLLSKCAFLLKATSAVADFALYNSPRLAERSYDFSLRKSGQPEPPWAAACDVPAATMPSPPIAPPPPPDLAIAAACSSPAAHAPPPLPVHAAPRRYLSFELDLGGWNNVRLAVETMLAIAIATNRTLVLPPPDYIYLLPGERVALTDLLRFDGLNERYDTVATAVHVLSMEDFLARETARPTTTTTTLHPGAGGGGSGRDSGGDTGGKLRCAPPPAAAMRDVATRGSPALWAYLRAHGVNPQWRPSSHCLLLNSHSDGDGGDGGSDGGGNSGGGGRRGRGDAATDAADAHFCRGRMAVSYSTALRRSWLLHIPTLCCCPLGLPSTTSGGGPRDCPWQTHWTRFAVPFYTFVRMRSAAADKQLKRALRDAIQPAAPIRCAAATIGAALDADLRAASAVSASGGGDDAAARGAHAASGAAASRIAYAALHLRRADFDQKLLGLSDAAPIVAALLSTDSGLTRGQPLFLLTDESDAAFLRPLRSAFRVRTLDDYLHALRGIPKLKLPLMRGMIEQLVAANAAMFIGSLHSTFSGFIARRRGYDLTPEHALNGTRWLAVASKPAAAAAAAGRGDVTAAADATTLAFESVRHEWPRPPFWSREWPLAWLHLEHPHAAHLPPTTAFFLRRLAAGARKARSCLERFGLGFDATSGQCTPAGAINAWHHFMTASDFALTVEARVVLTMNHARRGLPPPTARLPASMPRGHAQLHLHPTKCMAPNPNATLPADVTLASVADRRGPCACSREVALGRLAGCAFRVGRRSNEPFVYMAPPLPPEGCPDGAAVPPPPSPLPPLPPHIASG